MNQERMYSILLAPHATEKSMALTQHSNSYAFKVSLGANKIEIKEAVEKIYGVHVIAVTVVRVKGKCKRSKYRMTRRSSWKKAYVRLSEGQFIDYPKPA